jgi:ubiquinone biosynthesis protein UbiJ
MGSHCFEVVDDCLGGSIVVSAPRDNNEVLCPVTGEVQGETAAKSLEAADNQV